MYLSLHNRSCYSFELALTRPDQLADFAARHGMSAIALTDRDGLYGAVGFQQACERAGVKPIFGLELALAEGVEVTLLARALKGYANLCRLASLRHLGEAAVSVRQVCEHAGDVVCLIGEMRNVECRMRNVECGMRSPVCNEENDFQHSAFSIQHSALILFDAFSERLYVELAIHRVEDVGPAGHFPDQLIGGGAAADLFPVDKPGNMIHHCIGNGSEHNSVGKVTRPDKPVRFVRIDDPDPCSGRGEGRGRIG